MAMPTSAWASATAGGRMDWGRRGGAAEWGGGREGGGVSGEPTGATTHPPTRSPTHPPESLIPSPTMATARLPPCCSFLMCSALPAGSTCRAGREGVGGGAVAALRTQAQHAGATAGRRSLCSRASRPLLAGWQASRLAPCPTHLCADVQDAEAGGDGAGGGPAIPRHHMALQPLLPAPHMHA